MGLVTIHIHNHFDNNKLDKIMATQEQFAAQLARIQASLDKLTQNAGSLTAGQEDSVLADLTAKADALEALTNLPAPQG